MAEPLDPVEQYEALRREALEIAPFAPRGQGLALFLARGLSHWLMALTALVPARPARPWNDAPPGRPARLLPAVRAELTTVLAGMVLACTHDTEAR